MHPAEPARHHLHGHHTQARRVGLRHGIRKGFFHGEVVSRQHHIRCPLLHQERNHILGVVGAHAGKTNLALLPGDLLRLEKFVRQITGTVLPVQIPNVQVVGPQFAERRVKLLQRSLLGRSIGFTGKINILPLAFEGGAHQPLVVSVLVAAGGIEVIDAHVRRALDHAGVGGNHASKTHAGHFEAGFPQNAIAEALGGVRFRLRPGAGSRKQNPPRR